MRADLAFTLQVTSTASTTICWGCLNMEASRQRATTCSWGTMWTGGSSPWRPSVSSWPTKSNIQRTSSCWGEITSVHPSIEYMVSMMSVSIPLFYLFISYFRNVCISCISLCICYTHVLLLLMNWYVFLLSGKRRYNIKLWKTFTDCFNCLPIAAIVDEKIFCCHGGEILGCTEYCAT